MLELFEDRSAKRRRLLTAGIVIGAATAAAATAAVLWVHRQHKRQRADRRSEETAPEGFGGEPVDRPPVPLSRR